jgi:uncharacterized membrane protein YGL010W
MTNYNDKSQLNKFQKFFFDYGRYHRNPINILIHLIFIPLITLTFFLMFDHLSFKVLTLKFNIFYIIYGFWVPIYIYTDFITGLITSALYPLLYLYTKDVSFEIFGFSYIHSIILLHIFGWIVQFIGHGVFEKRKPALMDNPILMFNAPVFVLIEILYWLGYKKEEIQETFKFIDADIKEFKNSKKQN